MNRRSMLQQMAAITLLAGIDSPTVLKAQIGDTKHLPIFVGAKEGWTGKIGKMQIQFKFSTEQTSGTAGITEILIESGALGALPHYHDGFDELCYVKEGTIHILTGDTVTKVAAGEWHLRPRGMVHTFWNSGTVSAKTIEICLPGGHEKYLKELASLFENNQKPTKADFIKLENKHDIHYRPDLIAGIVQKYKVSL